MKVKGSPDGRVEIKLIGNGADSVAEVNVTNYAGSTDLGDGWWGCLYDESRRRKVLAGPPREERAKPVNRDDWNDYRIRCEGRRIQLWINGQQTVDYTETDASIERTGIIGLQIHGGPPSEAWYRNIRIKRL